jgi:hypothetical protein
MSIVKAIVNSKGVLRARTALLGTKTTVAPGTSQSKTPQSLMQRIQAQWWVLFPVVLGLLATIIAIRSHVPNTWLTGWDTLHPEFNFSLNLQRVLFGVFRPDQGLGSVATHAHVVELPRILILWLLSAIIPASLLRYTYVAICLVLGPIGIFVFTRYLLNKSRFSGTIAHTAAFCAGLWYLFNLGTLQHFALPFEMFPTNYAANGWLFWLLWRYLERGGRTNLFWLIVVNFLASNLAYSFISWYVYFGGVVLVILTLTFGKWVWKQSSAKDSFSLSRNLIAMGAILIANLYWLGPNLYFVATHSWHVPLAKNNRFVSEEIFFHNKEFGTIIDTITMKNHLFNWMIRDKGTFTLVFKEYSHYLQGAVSWIPLILFLVIMVGVVFAVTSSWRSHLKTKAWWLFPMVLPLLASVVAFLSLNPPLSFIFDILRDHISIAKEGLRNPFIKFNVLLMISYATFFAVGTAVVMQKIQTKLGTVSAVLIALIFTGMLTTTLGWPFLEGKLIDKRVQLSIPQEYFAMFEWFDEQPTHQRVMVLPAPHFWAWDYHDWGYQGAGFMWFGIKQSFLSRDSDRWNPYNEEAYREITTAIAGEQWQTLYKLLDKYQVRYLIFDKTVATNGERPSVLFTNEIERFLEDDTLFSKHQFSENLAVYEAKMLAQNTNSAVTHISQPALVEPNYLWHYRDVAFNQQGNYIGTPMYYPGRNLLTSNDQLNTELFTIDQHQLQLKTNSDQHLTYSLVDQDSIAFNVVARVQASQAFILLKPILPYTDQNQDTFSTAIPITIPTTQQGLFYVSINGTIFKATSQMSEDQPLGTIKVPLNQDNKLALYFNLSEETLDHLPTNQTALSFNCSVVGSAAQTNVEYKKNGAVLSAEANGSSCIQYPFIPASYSESLSDTTLSLIKFSFSTLDPTQTNAELCIFDTESNNCLNQQSVFSSSLDREVTTATILTELTATESGKTQLLLVLNNDQGTKKAELTFRALGINFTQPASQTTFQVRLPDDYQNPTLTASNSVTFPFLENSIITRFADLKRNVDSCGSTSKASVTREIVSDSEPAFVRYSAQHGQSCDKVAWDELAHDQGYVVAVTSRNISGIPIRMCVRNLVSGRCDLYVPLGTHSEFATEYFVLPPTDLGIGYAAHFTTFAPGSYGSVNDVSSVTITPIPFDLVMSLRTKTTDQNAARLADDQVVVTNNQSFEPNFVALWFKPPFTFTTLPKQVLVNNWANGWIIKKSQITEMQQSDYRLETFFLPDLLVIGGLVPLVGTLIVLGLWRDKK